MHELYLRRKSVYWECLMRPVLIIMVWKPWRSIAQSLMSVRAKDKTVKGQSKHATTTHVGSVHFLKWCICNMFNFWLACMKNSKNMLRGNLKFLSIDWKLDEQVSYICGVQTWTYARVEKMLNVFQSKWLSITLGFHNWAVLHLYSWSYECIWGESNFHPYFHI